ncbi:MAG: hypothetical protein LBJ45_00890 [Holosporaceae bacterium]|jgi:hypothetical protein|nr:hypothetical protein [Holosporaceae bacterium]
MLFSEILEKSLKKTLREEKLYKNISLRPNGELRSEVIRYLGYGNGVNITPEIDYLIQKGMLDICAIAEPRAIYRYFSLENYIDFPSRKDSAAFSGDSEKTCGLSLRLCDGIILMGTTLGIPVDQLLNRAQIRNMAYALVLDSCATAAIESVCDDLQNRLVTAYASQNKYLTNRYSPGYGNLQLSSQPQLLSLLDAERKIGVSVTQNFLLMPSKSVTAIIWASNFRQKTGRISCNVCGMRNRCYFKRMEAV